MNSVLNNDELSVQKCSIAFSRNFGGALYPVAVGNITGRMASLFIFIFFHFFIEESSLPVEEWLHSRVHNSSF